MQTSTRNENGYVTAPEYARYWSLSRDTVARLCREGQIPGAVKRGRNWRIPVTELEPNHGRDPRDM